jgi:DNA-directed RNA polymerase sigma subunit (sigma70/sigma32)
MASYNPQYNPERAEIFLMGILTDPERAHQLTSQVRDAKIGRYLQGVEEIERKVTELRTGLGDGSSYTLSETTRILNLSLIDIRQIETNALRKMQRLEQTAEEECRIF